MISFNETDINLKEISRRSKLFNLVTKFGYRVYGLKEESNVVIKIGYPSSHISPDQMTMIEDFFKHNNISVEIINDDLHRNPLIRIGLRLDLRQYPLFCATLLQTMIYAFEGRTKINPNFKITKVPELKSNLCAV